MMATGDAFEPRANHLLGQNFINPRPLPMPHTRVTVGCPRTSPTGPTSRIEAIGSRGLEAMPGMVTIL
ncbi:hypothetical protein SAMN00768000_3548 [Sulfobacillus thermosulfidooxidans DSM 9293]|uniref:Uncharacterized protein n=1 Tax=Sulfobacillus thermosulfidooxidans (strain DSM 9293 / VKM B-1269 / AT-1) TaxID=929705 RepID=A0A1W1WP18_SULTA|nr:hypothetical protein SAMN00768000_3548 [Sulfobacillus thermosulfidooxidans DSM 9293]